MVQYGYARVSSKDQNINRQIDALREFPIQDERIFVDRYTGASFERPQYRSLVRRMRSGDLLVVKSIDRLGRNYTEILRQWQLLTRERQVDIVVLDMPLLDTRGGDKDLTGTFISDVVLQLLSYIAQVERDNIRQRQAEGIAAAKARGMRFGRPCKQRPPTYEQIRQRVLARELTHAAAARTLGVSRTTFEKWLREDNTIATPAAGEPPELVETPEPLVLPEPAGTPLLIAPTGIVAQQPGKSKCNKRRES